jgi:hypothetical protein
VLRKSRTEEPTLRACDGTALCREASEMRLLRARTVRDWSV